MISRGRIRLRKKNNVPPPDSGCNYLPSEEEIRQWCEYFQRQWSPAERFSRTSSAYRSECESVPVVNHDYQSE